jgi:hypothetical protein
MPVEFEDGLGDALRRTADTFRPDDAGALVGAGHLRGRRLRRRRTATVVAGAAAIAAVAVGGVAAGGLAHSGSHGSGVAAAPEQPRRAQPAKPAAPPVSGKKVAAIFAGLLPSGTVTHLEGKGPKEFGFSFASATAVFDDGHGPAGVTVGVQRGGGGIDGCPPLAQNPGTWCAITHVHGGTLMVFKGYEYPDHRAGLKDWMARFVTADGSEVELDQWNSVREKGSPVTRKNPPLTVAEMTAMVTSDDWKPVLAGLGAPAKPGAGKAGTGKG